MQKPDGIEDVDVTTTSTKEKIIHLIAYIVLAGVIVFFVLASKHNEQFKQDTAELKERIDSISLVVESNGLITAADSPTK